MGTPEPYTLTDPKLKRRAWLSARDPHKRFDGLMQLFNEEALAGCFHELDGGKAVGTEGVAQADYGRELNDNRKELVSRRKRMA
jgi:hypothetical protein